MGHWEPKYNPKTDAHLMIIEWCEEAGYWDVEMADGRCGFTIQSGPEPAMTLEQYREEIGMDHIPLDRFEQMVKNGA